MLIFRRSSLSAIKVFEFDKNVRTIADLREGMILPDVYKRQSLYRFTFDESKILPSVFVAVSVAAAQRNEDGGNAVCQCFRQQVGSCLFPDLADFQILTAFEGSIFDILRFLGKDHFFQCGFTFGHSAYHIRESIGRDEVRCV